MTSHIYHRYHYNLQSLAAVKRTLQDRNLSKGSAGTWRVGLSHQAPPSFSTFVKPTYKSFSQTFPLLIIYFDRWHTERELWTGLDTNNMDFKFPHREIPKGESWCVLPSSARHRAELWLHCCIVSILTHTWPLTCSGPVVLGVYSAVILNPWGWY